MVKVTRRDALIHAAIGSAVSYSGIPSAALANSLTKPTDPDRVTRSATRVRGFADPEMDFQLLRSLGVANSMGAAVGEVLAAVRDIKDGDPRTWPPAFAALGEQTRSVARSACSKHPVSARDHFQRASMYYRAAEYYDDPVTETRERMDGITRSPSWKPSSSCPGNRRCCRSPSSTCGCQATSCNRPRPTLGPARR